MRVLKVIKQVLIMKAIRQVTEALMQAPAGIILVVEAGMPIQEFLMEGQETLYDNLKANSTILSSSLNPSEIFILSGLLFK